MPKNYIYRMDHDKGFAPKICNDKTCFLGGCKINTVEKWAEPDSWIIGLGGNNTTKPHKLIYIMKVAETLNRQDFTKKYSNKSQYLSGRMDVKRILIANYFYYFGRNAINMPTRLSRIMIDRQGCKCVTDDEIRILIKHIEHSGFKSGKHGQPNNIQQTYDGKCRTKCKSAKC